MKKLLCLVPILLLSACVIGENLTFEEKVQAHVEQVRSQDFSGITERMPEMIGGQQALYDVLVYPRRAMNAGAQGVVVLSFDVTEDGLPVDIEVIQSEREDFSEEAIKALEQMFFIPGVKNGERVRVRINQQVVFRLG